MRRIAPVAAVAATAALALTACAGGGGGPGPTAGQSEGTGWGTSTGPGSTDPGGTGSPSSTSTDTGEPFDPEEFTSRLEEAVAENPTVRISVDVTLDDQVSASAEGVQDLEENALDMDVDLGGQELGYLLVDGQYYLAQPPKWVPVTEDSENPLIEQTLDQIQILSMRRQFDAFIAGVEGAGVKGTEKVNGVKTTHYTATVDTEKSLGKMDMEKGPGVPDEVVYDVWLDEDDLVRKMTFTQNGATATMTASEWGEPVDIEKPTSSQLASPPESGTP